MLITRFELFLRRTGMKPVEVARQAGYSRQHVLRVRMGEAEPTRRFIQSVTAVCAELAHQTVAAGALFERGDELLASSEHRLSRMHAADLLALDDILARGPRSEWSERVWTAAIRSETAVRHLLQRGRRTIDENPRDAVAIFDLAAEMMTALHDTAPQLAASLAAHVLKSRANALRHMGRLDEALTDLEAAESLFDSTRFCENERGQVAYTRGTVLFKQERWPEALKATESSRRYFVASADPRRVAHADLLAAAILFEQGQWDAARSRWLDLHAALTELADHDAVARICQNLGACEIRRGRPHEARQWLNRASAAFRSLGNEMELARTRWNMATFIATFRGPASGRRALERVRRRFETLEAFVDAACVGLELLDLMLDETPEVLTRHAQDVAGVLVRAGLGPSAAEALERLRQLGSERNRREALQSVRNALRELDCGATSSPEVGAGVPPGLLTDA